MRKLLAPVLTVVCLLCACQTTDIPSLSTVDKRGADSAVIYQERAYQEMFTDSLGKAEMLAYSAYMLSNDSTMEHNSLALLSYIYYREGKQEQLQLLMQTVSPEIL